MRCCTNQSRTVVGLVATAMTASSAGLLVASAAPAGAIMAVRSTAPACSDAGLTSSGPTDNADGTTSAVVVGDSATATATIDIPVGVRSASLDVCGAQGTAVSGGAAGGDGGRGQATLAVTPGDQLHLQAGSSAGGGPAASGGGSGGGYSAVFRGAVSDTATVVILAGGGGGGGGVGSASGSGGAGGAGGGTQGQAGAFGSGAKNGQGGGGGSSSAGGPGGAGGTPASGGLPGTAGTNGDSTAGGQGGPGAAGGGGGGGGSGWYGGGGGGGGAGFGTGGPGGGGGGGSGHADTAPDVSGAVTTGTHTGAGYAIVTWATPAAPTFTSPAFADTTNESQPYSRTITVSATPTATISIDSGAAPPGISLTDNGDNTATLSGSPTVVGNYPFTLRASNGVGADDIQSDSIDVTAASPTPSPSATPTATVSPSATSTPSPGGGGGGGSPPASPSASPSNASSSSSGPSSGPGRQRLSLSTSTPDIQPNVQGIYTASGGAPNAPIELRCYTRPSTTYFTARNATVNASGGPVQFRILPGANTRCYVRYSGDESTASNSVVINVHATLSLSAVRTGVRTYVFQGRNLPRRAGQLITLYRVDAAGQEIRTSNLTTDASGIYRVTRTFSGTGTFRFKVRTSQTLNNAAGVSNTIAVTVH